ncbi:MAG: Gfo/Idh/MocA family oxidoreductase, partial [Xanthobacteraceae bacterium]|nr:Gfo/Idh/MocA family oxidoreductase [Xanthobacteraceae bacterium]
MATRTVGIIVNGATSRIGSTQHLRNALVPIRAEGGLAVGSDRVMPRVLLVGRNADRVAALGREHGLESTTDLDAALSDPAYEVLFDAAVTHRRETTIEKAIAAGKHVYSEKPVATGIAVGRALLRAMEARGLRHAAVEDKQHLPGVRKLANLAESGFFGRVIGFRLEFGWWVFDGLEERCQRPSWNYKSGGGGLILDMYPHFRYMIENVLGPIGRVACTATTAVPERIDEGGERYAVDVEDHAATLVTLASGAVGSILASWA